MKMPKLACLAVAVVMIAATADAAPPAASTNHIDFVTHNRIRIAATPATIWPHIVSLDWKQGSRLVATNGPRAGVGRTYDSVDDKGVTSHRVADVEMVAPRLRTIRLTELDGRLIGYAVWTLTPQGRSTLVRYDVYCFPNAVEDANLPPAAIAAAKRHYLDDNVRRFGKELVALKAMVEAGR